MSGTASDLAFAVELLSGIGRVEARRALAAAQAIKAAKPARARKSRSGGTGAPAGKA